MNRGTYCAAFGEAYRAFRRDVERMGLGFEPSESQPRELRLAGPWSCENGGCSLRRGWMSPACEACRTGLRTATFFVSLKCARSCWFCFNPNQQDYGRFLHEERDIAAELRAAHARGVEYDCLAVTGGEPFLHAEKVLKFLLAARELYPEAHVRVYTCGDLIDEALLERLRDAELDELRFSVKLDDSAAVRDRVLSVMETAVAFIPSVMVEMPVIPGTLPQMKALLERLDGMGVRGVNLLELCFPLHNAEEFRRRGLKLRRRPFRILYDYWYGGGIPVAGSEAEALELMEFAESRELRLGVHYCSSDNKNTGQVLQQNVPFLSGGRLADAYGFLGLDTRDYFLKCAKAFGGQAREVAALLGWLMRERADKLMAADDLRDDVAYPDDLPLGARWRLDSSEEHVSFPISWVDAVLCELPDADLAVSYNVVESQRGEFAVREVDCVSLADERFAQGLLEGRAVS